MTNVKSLLALYLKMGGSLTDTYSDIAGGIPVGQYSLISDAVLACSKKYSSGGGSLPADFPEEGIANANKFIGFDENGDYTAKAGGGGAEKFVVTLTADDSGAETVWTADKTIAEIVAADEANQVVVAKYPDAGMNVELPLNVAMEYQGIYAAMFVGLVNSGNDNKIVDVQCTNQGSGDVITTTEQQIPTSTNAPLIVTLTADQSTGNLVGNKTYKEVYDAVDGGQAVTLKGNTGSITFATNALSVGLGNDGYSVALVFGGSITEARGAANEYVMFTMN